MLTVRLTVVVDSIIGSAGDSMTDSFDSVTDIGADNVTASSVDSLIDSASFPCGR